MERISALDKTTRYAHASACIYELLDAITASDDEYEYQENLKRITCALLKYIQILTLILRSLQISCPNMQDLVHFSLSHEAYLQKIFDNFYRRVNKDNVEYKTKHVDLALL